MCGTKMLDLCRMSALALHNGDERWMLCLVRYRGLVLRALRVCATALPCTRPLSKKYFTYP